MSTKSDLPFTSVVSYHTNPLTCGVAKFSAQLAERLGVEFVGLGRLAACIRGDEGPWGDYPLLSLKWSEIEHWPGVKPWTNYGVFWHDAGDNSNVTMNARVVMYADPSLGSPGLWCPSLIEPKKRPVRLFSFGMAHKLQTEKYRRVRELLDKAKQPFHLRVSVGLHEGTSLDGVEKHFDALKAIMGPENVTILGILSDDAVREELHAADYVIAFFDGGLRANNTTVHAALEHRRPVVTNHGEQTCDVLRTITMDVNNPIWVRWLQGEAHVYSWDRLLSEMSKICAASQSPVAR